MQNTEEIDFGFLKIWNFAIMKNKYIQDANLLSRISKILETNQDYFSGSIKGIGVVSIENTDFREFNQQEIDLIKEARLILFISFLSKNNIMRVGINAGHWFASTENFNTAFQNFAIDSDHMAIRDGYIVNVMAGGYRMDKNIFYRPSNVLNPQFFSIDEDLLSNLLIIRSNKPRVFRKIIASIELLSESYYNSMLVSNNARILCQMSAFEMLLELPDIEQRKVFKNRVEAEVSHPNEKRYVHYYEVKGGINRKERRTLKGIWADQFYTLRNHIIHGLKINTKDYIFKKTQRHFDIALLFFIFFIKAQINKSLGKLVFSQRIEWEEYTEQNAGNYEKYYMFRYYTY
jgi:hypothetical protein